MYKKGIYLHENIQLLNIIYTNGYRYFYIMYTKQIYLHNVHKTINLYTMYIKWDYLHTISLHETYLHNAH